MYNKEILNCLVTGCMLLLVTACSVPQSLVHRTESKRVPAGYNQSLDSTNTAKSSWKDYFTDPYLTALIDTALLNNQELNITTQEIQIASNEIRARKGEYLPFVGLGASAGVEKVGRYTFQGATEATTDIEPEKEMPDPLPNYMVGAFANWEVDIWRKLRNAKKAAVSRYLSTVEGRNFMVTNLIAEIANSYYELLALDTQLEIVKQNIDLQSSALNWPYADLKPR
jgi:outer membrane protein, multidrug efflux system